MGATLDQLRAEYPEHDAVPDAEFAGRIIQAHPQLGQTDLMDAARPYLAHTSGVLEAPQQNRLADWYQALKSKASDLYTGMTSGASALGRDVKDVVTTPPNFKAPLMQDEEGNVTGGLLSTSPIGRALGLAQTQGRLPAVADLAQWLLPSSIQGKGTNALAPTIRGGEDVKPATTAIPAGPGAAFEGSPLAEAAKLTEQKALPVGRPLAEDIGAGPVRPRTPPTVPPDMINATPPGPGESAAEMGLKIKSWKDNRGSVDPNVAFAAARAAVGGTAGAMAGDTVEEKIYYGAIGAGLAAVLGSNTKTGGYIREWRDSLAKGLAEPSNATVWAEKWKAKGNAFFLPEDIARGDSAAKNIIHEANNATNQQHMIEAGFLKNLKEIYQPVAKDEEAIQRIHKVLDGQPLPLSPAEAQVALGVRGAFNDMAARANLDPQKLLKDYFPHLREEVNSTLQLDISAGGERIARKNIPQDYRPFYEKPRTLPSDESLDYGLTAVQAYARAAAKRIAMKGGTNLDDEVVGGFLNRVPQHLGALPEVPEIQNYWKDYVNDLVKGATPSKYSILTPEQASKIKHAEFLRTIGMNATSPVVNTMQTMNTFAITDARSWGAAWYDIFDPKMAAMARKSGVVSQDLGKADLLSLSNPDKLSLLLNKGTQVGGWAFGKTEEINRLHAFAAGYRDAQRAGLAGSDLIDYAKFIVDKTQFRFGGENLAPWMRGGHPTTSVVAQFKSYQMNQLQFLRNLVTDHPVAAIKYALGASALAGTDVLTGSDLGHTIRKHISDAFGGDPQDYKFRGALGEMGVYLGNQLGLGALPADNLSSLFFLLPGPAVAHVSDIVSAVTNRNYNITALASGQWGAELTPEQRATKITGSFPLAGVQLNRFRQAGVIAQTEGPNLRQPQNLTEAFALAPPTQRAGRPMEGQTREILNKVAGSSSMASQENFVRQQRVRQDTKDYQELVAKKAWAIRSGDIETVKDLNAESMQRFGRLPIVTPGTMRRTAEQATQPTLQRNIQQTPKAIRGRERQEAQD